MSQAILRTEGDEQIKPRPKKTRQIRPSQFLNQLDFLPLIDQSNYTEKPKHKKPSKSPIQLPVIQKSDPTIKVTEQERKYRHKHVSSLPDLQFQCIPHKMSVIEQSDNAIFKENQGRSSLVEQQQSILTTNRRRVEFRKSIIVVDLQNGALSKDVIDGSKKPLKRLTRKNTQHLKSEMI